MTFVIDLGLANIPLNITAIVSKGLYPAIANITEATIKPNNIAIIVDVIGFFKILTIVCITMFTPCH